MSDKLLDAVRLIVPDPNEAPWPTLGPQVCAFIEDNLVHGPGDVRGHPVEMHDELRAFLWRAYEVFPHGHPLAGRRRFKRVALFRRKGWAKTECLAFVAICEVDPTSPVRTIAWRKATTDDVSLGYERGSMVPVGGPVGSPYIPLVATTEEQSDDLAYAAVKAILEECELGNSYDIGLDRISPRDAPGKITSLAAAPSARDGALTSFQGFDEPHLFVSDRLIRAHSTMLRNVPKRKEADAWSMYASTMYEPGEGSVAEALHDYALDIARGLVKDASLYFDHRQAALVHDLSRRSGLLAAIEEASGDAFAFADTASIAAEYLDPTQSRSEFRRYWLNQRVKGEKRWIAPEAYEPLVKPRRRVKPGTKIVLAFDGSYSRDSTALVGCTIEEHPHVWVEGVWERPRSAAIGAWRTPRGEVLAAVARAMDHFDVVELAPDPHGWNHEIEGWEDEFGEVVVVFNTNEPSLMGPASDLFLNGAREADFTLDGHEAMRRHLGNCIGKDRRGYLVPVKASPDSPDKIDVAVAAVVAYARAHFHLVNPPTPSLSWKFV